MICHLDLNSVILFTAEPGWGLMVSYRMFIRMGGGFGGMWEWIRTGLAREIEEYSSTESPHILVGILCHAGVPP